MTMYASIAVTKYHRYAIFTSNNTMQDYFAINSDHIYPTPLYLKLINIFSQLLLHYKVHTYLRHCPEIEIMGQGIIVLILEITLI